MNKKVLSLFLVTVFIFMLLPLSASAETIYSADAYNAVCEGIRTQQLSIDVSAYSLSKAELKTLMQDILNNEPMFYYLGTGYSCSSSGLTLKVKTVLPIYNNTNSEISQMDDFVNRELDEILTTLPKGLDDYEKCLYLHDYICVNFEYDTQGTRYHDIYNMLYYKRGVCQAYTLLYDELLSRVGIETSAVSSASLGHIWNQVKLGGKWYHVDVTWDDPLSDTFAKAKHEFFLQSDSATAASHEANDFVSYYTSSDKSLDKMSWHENAISFAFVGGETFFIDNGIIKSIEISTDKFTEHYTIDAVWYTSDNGYYPEQNFSGLGSYKDKLIFNTDKEIKYYDPVTKEVGSAGSPVLGSDNIYRLLVRDNMAYYMHTVEYSLQGTVDKCEIVFTKDNAGSNNGNNGSNNENSDSNNENSGSNGGSDTETVVGDLGDVDLDGDIDANDYIYLKRAHFGLYVLSAEAKVAADIDHNEKIDANDYILLKRAYFGTYKIV